MLKKLIGFKDAIPIRGWVYWFARFSAQMGFSGQKRLVISRDTALNSGGFSAQKDKYRAHSVVGEGFSTQMVPCNQGYSSFYQRS
jgi:hypothetical protein